jgi:rhamnosyltransferase
MRPAHLIRITPRQYNPSRVMNHGMRLARHDVCLFLNADATPVGKDWLRALATPLQDPATAAVFGRQIPRPDCRAVFACDYERCFGERRESSSWNHFFSMVSSGLRRDVWSLRGFREDLQYAEDDEYTRWCLEHGWKVRYVPEAVAMHSHNYTPQESYRRSFGDSLALARAGSALPSPLPPLWEVLAGVTRDAWRDLLYCTKHHCWTEWPHALNVRWHQRKGKAAGLREGKTLTPAGP